MLFAFVLFTMIGRAQTFVEAKMHYFFDNDEFAGSSFARDKTLSGVHLSPEIGLNLPFNGQIRAGVDMLSLSGSPALVDKAELLAYFRFKDKLNRLYIGNFPKEKTLTNYGDFFFSDSSRYFNPNINGVFVERGNPDQYVQFWMDWTGMQSKFQRETFYLGSSGYIQRGDFFAMYKSYMYHYANSIVRSSDMKVTDNALINILAGWKYEFIPGIEFVQLSAGILAGYERERQGQNAPYTPVGMTARMEFKSKWWGTYTRMYLGQPHNIYFPSQTYHLYWNNPFLRGPYYVRSEWFLNFMKNDYAEGAITAGLHFSEGKMYFEQRLSLKIDLEVYSGK